MANYPIHRDGEPEDMVCILCGKRTEGFDWLEESRRSNGELCGGSFLGHAYRFTTDPTAVERFPEAVR